MFVLLAVGLMLAAATILGAGFIVWVAREHNDAKKYRHLVKLYEELKKQEPVQKGGFKVNMKGGKVMYVPGSNEGEAMRNLINQGADINRIESMNAN